MMKYVSPQRVQKELKCINSMIVLMMPPNVKAVAQGDGVPVGALGPQRSDGMNPTQAVKGGSFLKLYQEADKNRSVVMVVGYTDDGRLATRDNTGNMRLVDPVKAEARISTWTPPRGDY